MAENDDLLTEPKPTYKIAATSLLRTVVSMMVFIAVDYWIFKSWGAVILLVTVIFLHELGHLIAMKVFKYRGINMTFIPFMGAYVSGQATHFSKSKKIIMLLAGPMPGIIIGMVLLLLYQHNFNEHYYMAALAFLMLNIFNLIPVNPLDGGQFMETMFFKSNQFVQMVFLVFSFAVVIYFVYRLRSWFLIVIAYFILMRIKSLDLTYRVRRELDKQNVPYDCTYDDLTDEQYAHIRDILVVQSSALKRRFLPGEHSVREAELISYVEKILVPSYDYSLTKTQVYVFLLIYLMAFILPGIQWGYMKGWFR